MTIHVAKGLEFDNVFLICFNDGAFPNQRSVAESGQDGEEEERRLAYVAFTRAKKNLYVSCNNGYSYTTDTNATPSKFIGEAGLSLPPGRGYYGGRSWKPKFASRDNDDGYYMDEPAHNDFGYEKAQPKEDYSKPLTNGITDWRAGDRIHHERFGDGEVIKIIDTNIMVVRFETAGQKTLLSSHPMISKISSKGGDA